MSTLEFVYTCLRLNKCHICRDLISTYMPNSLCLCIHSMSHLKKDCLKFKNNHSLIYINIYMNIYIYQQFTLTLTFLFVDLFFISDWLKTTICLTCMIILRRQFLFFLCLLFFTIYLFILIYLQYQSRIVLYT